MTWGKTIRQNKFITNSFWLIGEKVISLGVVLVVNILMARQLGAEAFGILSYLLAIFALLSPLSSIGFNALITRELVNQVTDTTKIMSTALAFRVLGSVIALLISGLVLSTWTPEGIAGKQWAFMLFAAVNVFNAFHVIDFWFQAKLRNKTIVVCRLINTLTFSLVKLICFLNEASLDTYIWVHALEFLILAVFFIGAFYRDNAKFVFSAIDWRYGVKLLKQASWLILSGLASIIYLKIDQIMLGEMVSSSEVGLYAVASRLSEVWYFFATAIVTAYFPKILELKQKSVSTEYQDQLQKTCDMLFGLALAIAIVVSLIGPWVVVLLFGAEYQQAGAILIIHIWASVFVFMRALLSKWLIAEHIVKYSLVTHGVGTVINVSLNVVLIPDLGAIGAAIATVVSYAAASYFALFFSRITWPMAKIMSKSLFIPFRLVAHGLKLPREQ